jgi:molybdopterin converting factor small subunit
MSIQVHYFAQAAESLGKSEESFDVDSIVSLFQEIATRHGHNATTVVCTPNGEAAPWILLDVNGTLVQQRTATLNDGDVVRLISPISGG